MSLYSHNDVQDPLSGQRFDIRGYDNATQAQISFATNQANYNMAKEQNQWNYDMWRQQNAYNSPQNQIRLLAEAGINPNSYSPQGMTAAQLSSADLSVAGTPQLTPNSDVDRINTIIQGVGGVSDQVLNTLNSIFNAESLKAGIAESKQRQRQANVMNPLLSRFQELQNNIAGEHQSQEQYKSIQEYFNTLSSEAHASMDQYTAQHYAEQFQEALKLSKSTRHLNYWKYKEILKQIDSLDVTTDINKWTRDFMQRTGVDPKSDGVSQLIQLALSEPGKASQVIHLLMQNLKEAGRSLFDEVSKPLTDAVVKQGGYLVSPPLLKNRFKRK